MLPNPWILLGVVLTWLSTLLAVGLWQRHDGALEANNKCLASQNAELTAARATIDKMNKDKAATEKQHAAELAADGATYEKAIDNLQALRRNDDAAYRAGALRLRVRATCPAPAGGLQAGAPAAPAGGDGSTTVELPDSVTRDLHDFAFDADRNTEQLTLCQATVMSYYKACSAK